MIWVLVGYMWLFLHRPFEIWPQLATIRLERLYMIFTLIAWFAISPKTWTNNRNNAVLLFVAFSIFISTLLSPYNGLGSNTTMENWFKVFVFFLLVITSVKTEKDLKILVTAFTVCFTLYMFHSYWEFLNGKYVYRMGIRRMIGVDSTLNNPNSLGNSINYAICLLLPLLAFAKEIKQKNQKRLAYLLLFGSFGLSCLCIQLTGSRSSFAVLGISLLGLALLSRHRVRILVGFIILASIIWITAPERLKIRYISIVDSSVLEDADMKGAKESAEGRMAGFWGGIEVWQQNMLFGVGPGCYAQTSRGSGFKTHQLYSQILSELGTLGAIAYLSLLAAVFSNHWGAHLFYNRMKRLGREKEALYLYRVSFGVVWAVFLLLLLGIGGHNAFRFTWVWYAAFQAISVELLRQKMNAAVKFNRKTHDLAIKQKSMV